MEWNLISIYTKSLRYLYLREVNYNNKKKKECGEI